MSSHADVSLAGLMKCLNLADGLSLPLDAVKQSFAVLATRRPRSTHAATVLVEEMVSERLPVVILDSTGLWHGLRVSADAKSVGLPVYIFGGPHSDFAFRATSARAVADLVIELRQPAIVNLSGLSQPVALGFANDFA